MNILVTGGAGFIGSNFLHYMMSKYPNYNLTCLDSLTYAGNMSSIHELMNKDNFKFIKGDITDVELVDELFLKSSFDYVINFAAESHVDRSILNPSIFLKTNVIGTQVLLDASMKYKIKRFHQVSTDEVYGDLPLEATEVKFTETMNINPSSPYSASKASADLLVLSYFKTYNFDVTISRCSNNYGPYHFPEKLIPLIITRALEDNDIPVYGDGKNIRDWIHVYDHCSAIDVIVNCGVAGEVYNVGSNNEIENIEVVKSILNLLRKPESLIRFVTDRAGHDKRYAIDANKLTKLGWVAQYSFYDGIIETVDWYKKNEDWWRKVISEEYLEYYDTVYCSKRG